MPSDSESNSNPPKSPTAVKKAAPDGDHRKKRRNRTTQSCLNCHFSKRMCNRKRPSCARCTQLGLSGLCVYEVDDPGQKQDPQDEHARLTTRVAELEAVIRELKKKPHPRWAWPEQQMDGPDGKRRQPQQPSEDSMDTGSDSREPALVESPPSEDLPLCIPRAPSSSSSSRPITPDSSLPSPYPLYHTSSGGYLSAPDLTLDALLQPFPFGGESPMSTPSDYFSQMGGMGLRIGDSMHSSHGPFDPPNSCHGKDMARCGCLHETGNHTLVLDLSMRLRKAADVLTRSPCHCQGGSCLLTRRIADLDRYIVNSLERLTVLSDDASMLPADGPRLDNISNLVGRPSRSNSWGQMNYSQQIQPINLALLNSPSTSPDDAFMSWKPPRRE